jgi:hypothetical protein
MEITEIVSMISTVGFPIAMCIMLCWYVKSTNDSYRQDIKSLQQSIDNNTAVMNKIINKLEE